ncbi:MAG: SLBB domain-containing protein, partial [Pseudobdellovibrio sp.]
RLPYNVNIQASGLTLKALSEKIVGQYQSFYKKNAQIQVRLTERKYYIEVRGLVQKPGVILVSEREKIEEIIKKSGDLTLANEARVVQIQRGENTYVIGLEEYFQGLGINRSPRWFGGEKVFFLKSSAAYNEDESTGIQFLGDVKNPGALTYVDKADFYHYLIKSGGTTPSSDLDRIQVVRMTKNGRAVTKGSAKDIAEHITLEPGDTIIVGSGMSGQYERNIQLGSLITTIISTLAILVIAF